MKKITAIVCLFFLLMWGQAMSQTRVLRCYSYASQHKDYYGNWTEFTQTEATNFEIVVNFTAMYFSFFSQQPHHYTVLREEGHNVDKDGDDVYSFYCRDGEGKKCRIQIYRLNSNGGRNQIYISFSDLCLVYNVETIK